MADHPHGFELGGCRALVDAPAREVDGALLPLEAHASVEVRQMKGNPCPEDGDRVVRVQGKEPTPGTPSRWTYVLTFSSWDSLKDGSGGVNAGLTPHIVNGVMPTHARPS